MFAAACALALLCLVSLSHSAPLSCEELVRPLDQLDPHYLEERWVFTAGSINDSSRADVVLKGRDSVAIDISSSLWTQNYRVGDLCHSFSHNTSMEGHILKVKVKDYNFTGTFLRTSCQDCMVMNLAVVSPDYKAVDIYLFSRRREVEPEVIEEFRAQVQCLNMPSPVIMDPNKELCPEQTASKPTAPTEEKTE